MQNIKVGIAGGAGYTGGELIRLLIRHPYVQLSFVHSRSHAGKFLHDVHYDLIGDTELAFTNELNKDIDLLFLCVGHGEAKQFFEEFKLSENIKVIDLSQDFRLKEKSLIDSRQFVYGLPELNRDLIKTASNIANPGCFATAIELGLLPLAKEGILKSIYTTGITGSTGAGQSLNATSHFSWRANNVQAYKSLTHQHMGEILETLDDTSRKAGHSESVMENIHLSFVPWRGDFTRGIFISSQMHCDLAIEELSVLYNEYYRDHPFVFIDTNAIFLKQVVQTNKCLIQLEKVGEVLVVHSVIDNLLKGASGQAVQNMNLMYGFDETTGLNLKAGFF
jgi:N-acetyl-gamma-glutamyl-phosphate reductase